MNAPATTPQLAHNITPLAHMELPGAGQVYIQGQYAFVGHLTNSQKLGTSILDISEPRKPRIVSQIMLDDPDSHSHKARVIGDIMIVNSEQNGSALGRKSEVLATARTQLEQQLGRAPTARELAQRLAVSESDIPALETAERNPYEQGGFRIYDVKDKTKPKLITFVKTGGKGVHRYDMDENYAYISTEMPGYLGAMLVIYDIRNPSKPEEVSRWWLPGQHTAGGEKPTWPGRRNRLHHALRSGDHLWAGCWMAGPRIIDVTDIRNPKTVGAYNYHPPFVEPTHTFMEMPVPIAGKRIAVAIDEEDHAHGAEEMQQRRGRPHACLWVFDVSDFSSIKPLSIYTGERARFAVEPRGARPLRRAPVSRAHAQGHAGLLHLVLGRLAHRRRRRSRCAAGSRLVRTGAGARQGGPAHERRGYGRSRPSIRRRSRTAFRRARIQAVVRLRRGSARIAGSSNRWLDSILAAD